jgi:phosphate transport system substrate-binding protein
MTPANDSLTRSLRASIALFTLCACFFIVGCKQQSAKASSKLDVPPGAVLLKGAGATFPSPLYKNWFATYQQKHPDTFISYDGVGSGEGVRRFTNVNVAPEEQVDFGASDAAMTDEQIARVSKGALLIPMTAGTVTVAYNLPDFDSDLKLSRTALAGIFSGEIRSWNDPRIAKSNPGVQLPKLTIVTVVRQDASGTTFAFTKHLDAISELWRSKYGPATLVNWPGNTIRAKGNEGVAGALQHAEGSIGYVGYEFARRLALKTALLENKAGRFVAPSPESASAALRGVQIPENLRIFVPDPDGPDSYPIVTMSWILAYKNYSDPKKSGILRGFFTWCLNDGQNDALALGYVPLPQTVASKSLGAVQSIQ